MNKIEARRALAEGHKVRHRFFTSEEWLTQEKDKGYIDEKGNVIDPQVFWSDRKSIQWATDWEIVYEETVELKRGKVYKLAIEGNEPVLILYVNDDGTLKIKSHD
jgi:prenyltransferase beta subunit